MPLPQLELRDLIAAVDLVAYASQYRSLEQRRDGCYWGLSPFKEERTPSFNIDPGKQLYYDFATGKGGDALQFAKDYHGIGTAEAVRLLKAYANITDGSPGTVRLDAAKIAKQYRPRQPARGDVPLSHLPEGYMDYMYERAPDRMAIWLAEGIGADSMERFQVRYDSVSNRLVFPVRGMDGGIINVCGRTLDEDYKAKRIPKYVYMLPIVLRMAGRRVVWSVLLPGKS